MMRNQLFIFLLFALFLACRKDEGPEYDQITEEDKAWWFYKAGSYWIYQDSISGLTDTLEILSSVITKEFSQPHKGGDKGLYYDYMVSTYKPNYDSLLNEQMAGWGALWRNYAGSISHTIFDRDHMYLGQPMNSHGIDGNVSCTTTILNEFGSYTVSNHVFPDVKEIKVEDHVQKLEVRYFLSKHYGLIRKCVIDSVQSRTWNVISSHAIQ